MSLSTVTLGPEPRAGTTRRKASWQMTEVRRVQADGRNILQPSNFFRQFAWHPTRAQNKKFLIWHLVNY